MTKKKSDKTVLEEVKMDISPEEFTPDNDETPNTNPIQICGLKVNGMDEMLCYLQKDDEGGRYICTNPAKQGQYKIAFQPQSPASRGVLFVPYGQMNYIYEPKKELVDEWLAKFQHTQSSETKKKPKFTG
jgi:hypothetical protein